MVYDWLDQNKEALLENWKRIEEPKPFNRIKPLDQMSANSPLIKVEQAEYLSGYQIKLTFSDGLSGVV